jgi:hypothetical protein
MPSSCIFQGFFLETGIAVVFYIVFKLATNNGCVTLSLLVPGRMRYNGGGMV